MSTTVRDSAAPAARTWSEMRLSSWACSSLTSSESAFSSWRVSWARASSTSGAPPRSSRSSSALAAVSYCCQRAPRASSRAETSPSTRRVLLATQRHGGAGHPPPLVELLADQRREVGPDHRQVGPARGRVEVAQLEGARGDPVLHLQLGGDAAEREVAGGEQLQVPAEVLQARHRQRRHQAEGGQGDGEGEEDLGGDSAHSEGGHPTASLGGGSWVPNGPAPSSPTRTPSTGVRHDRPRHPPRARRCPRRRRLLHAVAQRPRRGRRAGRPGSRRPGPRRRRRSRRWPPRRGS